MAAIRSVSLRRRQVRIPETVVQTGNPISVSSSTTVLIVGTLTGTNGYLSPTIETTVNVTGRGPEYGTISLTSDTVVSTKGTYLHNGIISNSSNTITNIVGASFKVGSLSISSDVTTSLVGFSVLSAVCNASSSTTTNIIGVGVYTYLGILSPTADTNTTISAIEIHAGSLSAIIDTITTITAQKFVDHFASIFLIPKTKTNIDARLMETGTISTFFGSRMFANAAMIYDVRLALIVDTTTNIKYRLIRNSGTSLNINTTTLSYGSFLRKGVIVTNNNTYSSIVGGVKSPSNTHVRITASTNIKNSLTKGAKCVIIGETSTSILSYNYVFVKLSLVSNTTVVILSDITRLAKASIYSTSDTLQSGIVYRGGRVSAQINTFTNVFDYIIPPCDKIQSTIIEKIDSTSVKETINNTKVICGKL